MDVFDLSQVASLHEKERLQLGRWLMGGFAIVTIPVLIAGLLGIGRRIGLHGGPPLVVALALGVTFDLCLWWGALYLFGPVPVSAEVAPGSIRFVYRTGRTQVFRTRDKGIRMKLAETLPPADLTRRDIIPDAPYFVVRRLKWLPLSIEAYRAISVELTTAKLTPSVRVQPNPPAGGWKIYLYKPTGSGASASGSRS